MKGWLIISERLFKVSPCKGEQISFRISGVGVEIIVTVGGNGEGEGIWVGVVVEAGILSDDSCGFMDAVEAQPAQTIIIKISRKFGNFT